MILNKKNPKKARRQRMSIPQGIFETLESRQLMSTTYYVATTGNDNNAGTSAAPFATIQNAVQYLKAGDTLDVRAGTYTGFVIGWDAPNNGQYSEIDGTATAPITIQADPAAAPGSVIINNRNNKTGDAIDLEIDENGCNYITIKGFDIDNSSGLITRDGIHVTNATGVNVIDNTVNKITRFGIYSSFTTNMLVQGNTVTNTTQGDGTTSEGHGIYISNSAVSPSIIGNTIYDNATQGLHFNGDISQGGTGMITGALVEDNLIYNNGENGINGDGLANSTIENNIIYGNAKHGISLYQIDAASPSTGNLIVNNTIYQPNSSGTALQIEDGSKNNTVFNNILIGGADGSYNIDASSQVGLVSDYNVVTNTFNTEDTDGDTSGTYSLAQWQSKFGVEAHSIVATGAQLFTNAGGNIFTLASSSTAINKGIATLNGKAAPNVDIVGDARPNGGSPDIGAYEVAGAAPPSGSGDTTAPTASLSASGVTTAGATTYTFTVVYSDNSGINVASLNNSDVTVTGPNGFSQAATFVSVDTNTNGTPRTATYSITPPGGSWNSADNGTYTATVNAGQVTDTSGNAVAAGSLGTFSVNVAAPDTTAPTASLSASNVTTGGAGTYTFTVTYADNVAINVATIDSSDVKVSGPNGFSQTATLVSVNNNTNGTPRTATYSINTPGGSWDNADNGTYTVAMVSGQVADTSGNSVAAGNLGTFSVNVAAQQPSDTTAPTASLNASNVTTSGQTSYTFTVTFSDNVAVNVASLGNGDLTVTGPKGFSQNATFVSVDTNSNGTPRTATYSIAAPGGAWDSTDNGVYSISVNSGQVSDTSGNTVGAGVLGMFSVAAPVQQQQQGSGDTTAPTATLVAPSVTRAGAPTYYFAVTYSDNVSVNSASIPPATVVVTGPRGMNQVARLFSLDNTANGPTRTAIYAISTPQGSWGTLDSGTYTVSLQGGQVADTSGNTMASTTLGTFTVKITSDHYTRTAPTATLGAASVSTGGGTNYTFSVTYTDANGVDLSTIDSSDVKVTGPHNFGQTAALVSLKLNADGSVVATYAIMPPGGSWSSNADGTYNVNLNSTQVSDLLGDYMSAKTVGSFSVSV